MKERMFNKEEMNEKEQGKRIEIMEDKSIHMYYITKSDPPIPILTTSVMALLEYPIVALRIQ